MNDERLAELKEKYKDRNLLEELAWGAYADHSGYTSKQNGEFLNWLCLVAYKALKERPLGEPVIKCKDCKYQRKVWIEDRRMKEKGFWAYGCNLCNDFGGDDEFCSDAEIKEEKNDK